jgi:2-dehydro-3-deoxyphosphogluconate aldolase/(4S)-4-hydroxy-2-oxoglutarate aldolase
VETVKFFPAEAAGGIKMIRAMAAPYKKINFLPTGGINELNLKDYLDFNQVIACGGTWMIDNKMLWEGDFAGIQKQVEKAVESMLNLHFLCKASDQEIMIQTNYMERAIYHMEMRGYHFLSESAEESKQGDIIKIKLSGEINGKSLYLVKAQ